MALYDVLINIATNTASLETGLRRAQDSIEQFASGAKRALEFTGISLSFAALSDSFQKTAESGEQMLTLATRMGTSVQSLSQLQYAAQATNVPFQTLTSSMDILSRNLVQASEGSGKARQAIADLGIDAQKLASIPLDQQLDIIANKIAALPNPTQQTAAAMRIFGGAGADLLPILRQGADGIDQLRARADALGITLTGDTAEALGKANRAMTDLSAASHAFWTQLLGDVAPAVENWEKGALRIEQATRHMLGSFSSPQDQLHYLTTEIIEASNEVAKLAADTGLKAWYDRVGGGTALAASRLEDLRLQIVAVQRQMAVAPPAPAKSPLPNAGTGFDLAEFARESEKRLDAEQKYYDGLDAMTQTDVEATAAAYDQKYSDLTLLLARQQIDYQEYLNRIAALNDATFTPIEVTAKYIGKVTKTVYDDMEKYANSAATSIQSSFATFLEDPSKNAFKQMGAAWLQTIDKMVSDAASADLFKALFGTQGTSGALGSGGLGGIFGGILNAIFGVSSKGGGLEDDGLVGEIQSPGLLSIAGAANGASFDTGGSGGTDSQLVAFWATPGEHVQVGGGGGGAPVTINNYVTVTSPQVTKSDVIAAMAQTQASTVNKLQDMKRRGRF